jgi:hypothetical protein
MGATKCNIAGSEIGRTVTGGTPPVGTHKIPLKEGSHKSELSSKEESNRCTRPVAYDLNLVGSRDIGRTCYSKRFGQLLVVVRIEIHSDRLD